MNSMCPNDERLKSLIMEAFDELSAPDPAHIRQIAEHLGRQLPVRTDQHAPIRRWLFWLLFGVAATATAWWGGARLLTNTTPDPLTPTQPLVTEPVIGKHTNQTESAASQTTGPEPGNEQHDSPVIFQREQY